MYEMLAEYTDIILDFSAMFAQIDSLWLDALNRVEVQTSSTFSCECKHIQTVAPERLCKNYQHNKTHLPNLYPVQLPGLPGFDTDTDTLNLVYFRLFMSNQETKILILEANNALEDQIIFQGIKADLYSFIQKKRFRYQDFLQEAQARNISRSICYTKTPLPYYTADTGTPVYTEKEHYVLDEPLTRGREAVIFQVKDHPAILVKVFRQDEDDQFVLTKQKLRNIQNLQEIGDFWDVPWLAFPYSVVYVDAARTKPIGYLMQYFRNMDFFSDNPLFNGGDIRKTFPEHNQTTVKDVLRICIKFVRQILFLSINNFHISDYNDKNFALQQGDKLRLVMVDTDSYCYKDYVSECITYPELKQPLPFPTKLDLITLCDKSLYAFVFTRLMLDFSISPIRETGFLFSKDRLATMRNPMLKQKWNTIPENLQQLFTRVFENRQPPSISKLLVALDEACHDRATGRRYRDLFGQVLHTSSTPHLFGEGLHTSPTPHRFGEGLHTSPTPSHPQSQSPRSPTSSSSSVSAFASSFSPSPPQPQRQQKPKTIRLQVVAILCLLAVLAAVYFYRRNQPETVETQGEANTLELHRFEMEGGYYLTSSENGDTLSEVEGYVEVYWDAGDNYKGNYLDGKRNGYGEYTWSSGNRFVGVYANGERLKGTLFYANGRQYTGSFANSKESGQGTLYDADGHKIYSGGWKGGYFDGKGTYYFPDLIYQYDADWSNGTTNQGADVELTLLKGDNPETIASGHWFENVFYGTYYKDGKWYELPA